MRGAILTAPRSIELVDREPEPLREQDVLLRVEQCGVCASDVDSWLGRGQEELPVALGHEVAGRVEATGSEVRHLKRGDRVAAWVEGGGFADQTTVEARYCVPVENHVTYPAVAEPLSCVVNAVELAGPRLGDDVLIIGGGYMGNLLQLVTGFTGARSTSVIDIRDAALEHARRLGADRAINVTSKSPADIMDQLSLPDGADITYEVTGTQGGLDLAARLTRMGGKLVIVGYHLGGVRTVPMGTWNWMAFHIINAHFRDRDLIMHGMRVGMRLVNAGALDVSQLVSVTLPLDRISEAFELASAKGDGFTKAVIVP
jgi:L-iditol 2-dehydrogenase